MRYAFFSYSSCRYPCKSRRFQNPLAYAQEYKVTRAGGSLALETLNEEWAVGSDVLTSLCLNDPARCAKILVDRIL